MKKSMTRLLRFQRNHTLPPAGAARQINHDPVAAGAPPGRRWRLGLFLLLCLAGSTVASFVVFRYVVPTIPRELVRAWEVMEGRLKGATLEFHWNGTAIATLDKQGKKEVTESSVKVEDKTLYLTSRDEATGQSETVSQKILALTANELVIRDEDRVTYRLKRVSN